MQKWVKVPGPGQFRGEGDWMKLEDYAKSFSKMSKEEVWAALQRTKFLPITESDEYPTLH